MLYQSYDDQNVDDLLVLLRVRKMDYLRALLVVNMSFP